MADYKWSVIDGELYLNTVVADTDYVPETPKWSWRFDSYTNDGYPYNGYMPVEKSYPELSRSRTKYFDLLDRVSVYSDPHGMHDVIFPITEMNIPLNSPENIKMVMGIKKQVSLTSVRNEFNEAIKKAITKIPKMSSVLESAKNNALELIRAGTSGYVTLNQGDDGYVKELIISDSPDYKNADNVWVWNINGLAFFKGGYDPENGKPAPGTEVPVAITADGQIVADFITTGLLSADRIRGGHLKIGGKDYPTGDVMIGDNINNSVSVFSNDESYEMRLAGGACAWYAPRPDGTKDHVAHFDAYGIPSGAEYPWLAVVSTGGIIWNPNNMGVINDEGSWQQCVRNERVKFLTNGPGEGVEEVEYIKDIELDEDGKIKNIVKEKMYFTSRQILQGMLVWDGYFEIN
jgi:hypothetical protein